MTNEKVSVVCTASPGSAHTDNLQPGLRSGAMETPVNLGPKVDTAAMESSRGLINNVLILLFNSDRKGGRGDFDVWMTFRKAINRLRGRPVNLGRRVNSEYFESRGYMSPDARPMLFGSNRPGGAGRQDIWSDAVLPGGGIEGLRR